MNQTPVRKGQLRKQTTKQKTKRYLKCTPWITKLFVEASPAQTLIRIYEYTNLESKFPVVRKRS